jgi:hypothetical protein
MSACGIKQYSSAYRLSVDAHGDDEHSLRISAQRFWECASNFRPRPRQPQKANTRPVSVDHENVPDVQLWGFHLGTEQSIVRFPKPSRDLPSHVHLYEHKLLQIPPVDPIKVGR